MATGDGVCVCACLWLEALGTGSPGAVVRAGAQTHPPKKRYLLLATEPPLQPDSICLICCLGYDQLL